MQHIMQVLKQKQNTHVYPWNSHYMELMEWHANKRVFMYCLSLALSSGNRLIALEQK